MTKPHRHLSFRCTGCGNCCKDPLLPLTDDDVRRISAHTGDKPRDFVRWVDRHGIEMDDEPEGFVLLRQGRRVMVLAHERGGCRYLDDDDRCSIYLGRPLGCRIFPFDPTFRRDGTLRYLTLIQATDCLYERDGKNDVVALKTLHERHEAATTAYQEKVAEWNQEQRRRRRRGQSARLSRDFFDFLGLAT